MVATLAPVAHEVIVTRFQNPRSYDPHALAEIVRQHGVAVQIVPDPVAALAQARCQAQPTDVICVTGSLYLVGEIKTRLQGLTPEF
jgi:dihydrofolate synthase/folylpolyglutamate synthase